MGETRRTVRNYLGTLQAMITLAQAFVMYVLVLTTNKGIQVKLFVTPMTLEDCKGKIVQLHDRNPKLNLQCKEVQ